MCLKFDMNQFLVNFLDCQDYQYHNSRKKTMFFEKIVFKTFALITRSIMEVIKPEGTEKEEFQFKGKSSQTY